MAAIASALVPGTAMAEPSTVAVTLGDSFISGEAGRWQGNSLVTGSTSGGTDRASGDPAGVYGATHASGCHRSDVAPALAADLAVDERINLACSGATSANVYRASNGGQSFKGEAPQADQLAGLARTRTVKLVVLSAGGNDLGFADIITRCVTAYMGYYYCNPGEQSGVDSLLPTVRANVGKAIDEVRAALASAGQAPGSYRFVLQSYPSPLSRGADNRYREYGWTRTSTGGCPFWNGDLDWARDRLTGQLSDALASVATAKGVTFLDLRDAFAGREVCAKASTQADSTHPPAGATSEWVRWLVTGWTSSPGDRQESFHPNAYGQQAMARCLTLIAQTTGLRYTCHNTPGQGPTSMYLT
ncbi:GDSL-type esterase/lipase family protein [Longispora albida]|uniref:GDSL-type esterase/lipase family protein n=1 Tax=Longispora albida TaxID=203523 RepID=UPI00068588CA|nr:GDSL-type esterase/lipase family protein [Longispora albida]